MFELGGCEEVRSSVLFSRHIDCRCLLMSQWYVIVVVRCMSPLFKPICR